MSTHPPDVSAVLQVLATELPALLGDDLVGIYLYGSLTQDAFVPVRSDVDLIAVTRRDLSAAQFDDLDHWLAARAEGSPWFERLQITFLIAGEVLTIDAPACLYQFGALRRTGSDGNPIIWQNVLDSGETLYGAAPETFLPEITPANVYRALRLELDYLRQELDSFDSAWRDKPLYRAYAVLTVCRILYTHTHDRVVSKPLAAAWVLDARDDRWEGIIRQALAHDETLQQVDIPLPTIREFVAWADGRLAR